MSINNQNNGGGNYHPKRNVNRNQHPSGYYNPAAAAGYVTPEYIQGYGAYGAQGYFNPATGVPQYYPQAGYNPQGSVYRPEYAHPAQHHHINLTTPTGEKVDIKSLHHTPTSANASLKKSSAASTPKATTPQLHQRTPSTVSSTSAAPITPKQEESKAALDMKEAFRQQVLARAKASKEKRIAEESAKAEPKAEQKVESTPEEAKTEVKEEPKVESKPEIKEESNVEAKPEVVEETKVEPVPEVKEESVDEHVKVEVEPKEESKDELEEEPKAEEIKEEIKEEIQEETESKSESVKAEESKPEPVEVEKEVTIIEDSIKEEPEPEDANLFTISKLFTQLKDAKPVEDPYNFPYPTGFIAPESKLQDPAKPKLPKLRYDPVFLLQFAEPLKLPTDNEFKTSIEFLEKNRFERSGSSKGGFKSFGQGSIGGFQGSFSKSGSNRKFDMNSRSNSRQNSKRKGGSGRDRKSNRNRDRDDEPQEPKEPPKPLEKSATRWIPKSRAAPVDEVKYAPDGVTVILGEEEVERKVKMLLNKLTLQYFDPITDDIIKIADQSQWEEHGETLKQVLNVTFDKATDEPHWSSMYAQFCAKLCKEINPAVKDTDILDNKNGGEPLSGGLLVRRYLLSKCQVEYEKGWAEDLPTNEDGSPLEPEMMTDEYYKIAKAKRRGLGLVRLIGHLYVLRLLSEQIILVCLYKLVTATNPTEEDVENLIQLVKTVGQNLDASANETTRQKMNQAFKSIEEMTEDKRIPSRLQFSLLDLVDLRRNKWKGGEAEKGPKTITEIHEEGEKKQLEQQRNRERSRKTDSRQNSSRNNSSWGANRLNESDLKRIGQISSPSSSTQSPLNNFNKTKSLRSRPSTTNVPEQSPSPLAAREGSSNAFALLGDHGDDDAEEEEEPKEEEEQKEEA